MPVPFIARESFSSDCLAIIIAAIIIIIIVAARLYTVFPHIKANGISPVVVVVEGPEVPVHS